MASESRGEQQPAPDASSSHDAASAAPQLPDAQRPQQAAWPWPHDAAAERDWASHGAVPNPVQPAPRRRRSRPLALIAALGLVGGTVLGGAAGAGVATMVANGSTSSATGDGATVTGAAAIDPSTIADVAETASESVVTVDVTSSSGSGTGSGVVVADGGIIVTNNHVVTLDGAASDASITVETSDGRLLDATVVGTDPTVDLAVLRVDADLPVVAFADSDDVQVGDTAIAIGSPLGLSNTVTSGLVSAVDRGLEIASSEQQEESPFGFWDEDGAQTASESVAVPVIQTDASINPGNSGGALLDSAGQLIGINVAIASMSDSQSSGGSIGIGFAIESSLVQRVVDEIVESGTATHGLLGASVTDVTDTSVGVVGAQVAEVTAGGAAEAAGLRAGDVVTAVDGEHVTSATDLTAQVRAQAAGAQVALTVQREDGSEEQVDVTLGGL